MHCIEVARMGRRVGSDFVGRDHRSGESQQVLTGEPVGRLMPLVEMESVRLEDAQCLPECPAKKRAVW